MSVQFWNTIAEYNQATWVAQSIICAIGMVLTIILYQKPSRQVKILYKLFLSFCFAWIAIVFFLLYGSAELNKYKTAALFALISILFIVDIFLNKTTFTKNKSYAKISYILYLSMFMYPLFSLMLGKHFPTITTWLMPCPLTVFTIALFISFFPLIDLKVFVLLIFWALTGLPKMFMFNVPEDIILFISGVIAILVWLLWAKKSRKNRIERGASG